MYAGQSAQQTRDAVAQITEGRQSEVTEEMQRLSRAVDLLGMTTNQLAERLHPVRSATGTGLNKNEPSAEPVLCPLADSVRAQRKAVEAFQADLQRVLNELEL
jgi:hypothetical protein